MKMYQLFFVIVFATAFFHLLSQDVVETSSLNNLKSSLDRHWYKRSFHFHYNIDAFGEFCSEIEGSGFSG